MQSSNSKCDNTFGRMASLRLALVQLKVGLNKADNLARLRGIIEKSTFDASKPNLVCLPECFNSPYGNKFFDEYAESIPDGETCKEVSAIAKKHKLWIVAGSIPERRDEKLFNTSVTFNPSGEVVGRFSKLHLFDVDVPGQFTFKESDTLNPGDKMFHFEIPCPTSGQKFVVGVGICYDIRFPEISLIYARKNKADVLLFPGAFSTTTGPAHWELLGRSRALDSQCYVGLCSPAEDKTASYVSHAESMICSPWGEVLCNAGKDEGVVSTDVLKERLESVRNSIPISKQQRLDLYSCPEYLKK